MQVQPRRVIQALHVAASWQDSSTQLARAGILICHPLVLSCVQSALVMYDTLFSLCRVNTLCPNWHSILNCIINRFCCSGVPRNFFFWGGGSTNSVEDRENGDLGGGSPLVRGSGGSCNLVQEISFHIVKFSQFLVL